MNALLMAMVIITSGFMAWWSAWSARRILKSGVVPLGWKGKGFGRKEYPGIFWYFVIGQIVGAVFCAILTILFLIVAWQWLHE